MDWMIFILMAILAYCLGSIPTAIWIGKWFFNLDIREHGSGNAGFSNALRVMGPKAGIPVLIIDVAKGFMAVKLATFVTVEPFGNLSGDLVPIIFGVLAFIGHMIPLFASFKGGKGVATGVGLVLALFPLAAVVGLSTFLVTILVFRMMSLGSMLGGISFPVSVYLLYDAETPVMLIFAIFIAVMIIFTHRSNIQRIAQGKENRIWFSKKNRKVDH